MIYRDIGMGGVDGAPQIEIPGSPERNEGRETGITLLGREDVTNMSAIVEFQMNLAEALAQNVVGRTLDKRIDIESYVPPKDYEYGLATKIGELLGNDDVNLFKIMCDDINFPEPGKHNEFIARMNANTFDEKDIENAVGYSIKYISNKDNFIGREDLQEKFRFVMIQRGSNDVIH